VGAGANAAFILKGPDVRLAGQYFEALKERIVWRITLAVEAELVGLTPIRTGNLQAAWSDTLEEIPELRGRLTAQSLCSQTRVAVGVADGDTPVRHGGPEPWLADFIEAGGLRAVAETPDHPMTPEEAVRWFKRKIPVRPEMFNAMTGSLKARAFTLSAWTSEKVLLSVYESTLSALEEGWSFSRWKESLPELYDRDGFMVDSNHYLKGVFNNAMLSSYAVQRYHGLKAASELRPWWQYLTVNDGHVRDSHRALHGRIYRHDDPIWATIYPPNGFRCRCTVKSLSDHQMEAQGLKQSSERGYVIDKGWDYNPALGPSLDLMDQPAGKARLVQLLGRSAYRRPEKIGFTDQVRTFPTIFELEKQGISRAEAPANYLNRLIGDDLWRQGVRVFEPVSPDGCGIPITEGTMAYAMKKESNRIKYSANLPASISKPFEVWEALYELENGRLELRRHYIAAFEGVGKDKGMVVVVSLERGQPAAILTFVPMSELSQLQKKRTGILLYPEPGK
jgi:SPP1 gp7 family putative phage head morphogenesis protein